MKQTLTELGKQNSYILNLIKVHRKDIEEKMENIFKPLNEDLKVYDFMTCVHLHYDPVVISIFNDTITDSHKLHIQDLKITEISSHFPNEVKCLVEKHLEILS